jgi:hypothetical protein
MTENREEILLPNSEGTENGEKKVRFKRLRAVGTAIKRNWRGLSTTKKVLMCVSLAASAAMIGLSAGAALAPLGVIAAANVSYAIVGCGLCAGAISGGMGIHNFHKLRTSEEWKGLRTGKKVSHVIRFGLGLVISAAAAVAPCLSAFSSIGAVATNAITIAKEGASLLDSATAVATTVADVVVEGASITAVTAFGTAANTVGFLSGAIGAFPSGMTLASTPLIGEAKKAVSQASTTVKGTGIVGKVLTVNWGKGKPKEEENRIKKEKEEKKQLSKQEKRGRQGKSLS